MFCYETYEMYKMYEILLTLLQEEQKKPLQRYKALGRILVSSQAIASIQVPQNVQSQRVSLETN